MARLSTLLPVRVSLHGPAHSDDPSPVTLSGQSVRVLAIDPGERCGWARATVTPELKWRDLSHGITPLKDLALKLHQVAGDYDVIVFETFRLRPAAARFLIGSDLQTAQMVGMIRLCAWLHPHVALVSQGPNVKSSARMTVPPWLKRTMKAMPKAHDDAHDGDALLHLWHWTWVTYA